METLSEIWPFAVGQQKQLLGFAGAAVISLIILNIFSAIRQGHSMQKIVSGFFAETYTNNKIEKIIRIVLFVFLVIGFIVLILDIQINGMQLVNVQELPNGK